MISQVREEEARANRIPKLKEIAKKAADEKKHADEAKAEEERKKKEEEERREKEKEEAERAERLAREKQAIMYEIFLFLTCLFFLFSLQRQLRFVQLTGKRTNPLQAADGVS